MPLDTARKIAHITAVLARSYAGRQKTVVFVALASGVYSYTAVSVIFRYQAKIDPEIPGQGGGAPGIPFDVLMIAPVGTSFTGVVYVADVTTATSGAVAAGAKYEIIEVLPMGIIPANTHIRCLLRRFR